MSIAGVIFYLFIWLVFGWTVRCFIKRFTGATSNWYLSTVIVLWPFVLAQFVYEWIDRKEYR